MKLDEWMRKTLPKARRSQLAQYKAEIRTLRTQGYAVQQIQEWLATEGLSITASAVQQYIARHLKNEDLTEAATTTPAQVEPLETTRKASRASTSAPQSLRRAQAAKSKLVAPADHTDDPANNPQNYSDPKAVKVRIAELQEASDNALRAFHTTESTELEKIKAAFEDRLSELS